MQKGQYEAANKQFLLAEGIFKNLYKDNFEICMKLSC